MKKRILNLGFLFLTLFLFGCGGPTTQEIGEAGLATSLGVGLLSMILVSMLSRISSNKKILMNRKFWLQYVIFIIISLSIVLYYHARYYPSGVNLGNLNYILFGFLQGQLLSILAIPYILLFTLIFIVALPKRYIEFIPSLIMIIYYLTFLIMAETNIEVLFIANPVIAPIFGWFISIPLFIGLIIYIRKKEI